MPTTTQNPRIAGARLQASDPAVDGQAFSAGVEYVLTTVSRGIWIGSAGNLTVDMLGGIEGRAAATSLTFAGCQAGTFIPIAVTKIHSTSTAAGVVLL